MCQLAAKCKNPATLVVVHKAVGAMAERRVDTCRQCAARIGAGSPAGALIDQPGRESRFYKIEGAA